MVNAAALVRPVFATREEGAAQPLVPLATGPGVQVLYFPPTLAPSGPHCFAGFAPAFAGEREVTVLPHPGFAVKTLTLYAHATFPPDGSTTVQTEDAWQPQWPLPTEGADVPGNRFAVMEDHSEITAHAVRDWPAAHHDETR